MNTAARKPVIHRIGSAKLNPANMRGFQSQIGPIKLNAVSTEGATMPPYGYHGIPKRAVPLRRPNRPAQFQSDGKADTLIQRFREMRGENLPCNFTDYLRTAAQFSKQ